LFCCKLESPPSTAEILARRNTYIDSTSTRSLAVLALNLAQAAEGRAQHRYTGRRSRHLNGLVGRERLELLNLMTAIDLYADKTPNGRKPAIMLEEVGLDYRLHKVDLSKGEQFSPEFMTLSPNAKIPAIADRDAGIQLFESGAILIYLAEKTGQLLPTETAPRAEVIAWLMFQMGNVGPMFGQLGHFRRASEQIPYAIERYRSETLRLFGVMDKQLAKREFLAGDYSIADIATYPWVAVYPNLGLTLDEHPHLKRWAETLQARPAVQRGMALAGLD